MRKTMLIAAGMMTLTAGALQAQSEPGRLTISGTSTVRSWSCSTQQFDTSIRPAGNFEGILRGEKLVQGVTLRFPVAQIGCGNGTMEGHLRKALKAGQHPNVTYELSTYELAAAAGGMTVQAMGQLTIAGTTRPIEMTMTVARGSDGQLRVRGETPLTMTTFGVEPPKLMLGTLKVGDAIKVSFDVPLGADAARAVTSLIQK